MTGTGRYQRRIRKTIRGDGVQINIASDVNVVTARGGSASTVQRTSVVQGRVPAGARADQQSEGEAHG